MATKNESNGNSKRKVVYTIIDRQRDEKKF